MEYTHQQEQRLRCFDALRGFSMIFVVFSHVLLFSFGLTTDSKDSVVNEILITFRMPLFFFVSGFFAYKACGRWTAALAGDVVKRKIQAQVIGTMVFYTLYLFCHGQGIFSWLHTGFQGYWFTITLFQIFLIFLMLSLLSRLLGTERILVIGLLLVSSLYFLSSRIPVFRGIWDFRLGEILCHGKVYYYFQFFALGVLCRKYWPRVSCLLSKDWFKTCSIALFTLCLCLLHLNIQKLPPPPKIFTDIAEISVRYAGLMIVVSFFFSKQEFFNGSSRASSLLEFIGQRTLDIYLIHFFLIPDLPFLKPYLSTGNTIIPQLFFGVAVSMAIISVCLLISNVLRSSSFLASWLFGVKPR